MAVVLAASNRNAGGVAARCRSGGNEVDKTPVTEGFFCGWERSRGRGHNAGMNPTQSKIIALLRSAHPRNQGSGAAQHANC